MDPNSAQSIAIQQMLANATPEYIEYLRSQGMIPANYAAPAAQAPAAPPQMQMGTLPQPALTMAPMQAVDPMERELARYFGVM